MTEVEIKTSVRKRDGMRCIDCGITSREHKARCGRTLDVHRTVPNSEYTEDGCVTLCIPCHRKRHANAPGKAVLIRRDLVTRAKFIAISKNITLTGYLNVLLRPLLDRDWKWAVEEFSKKINQSAD